MVPSLLRRQCYTIEKDVCEFVDQFPGIGKLQGLPEMPELKTGELMSQNDSNLLGVALALGFSLPGGALAWYFTRKKQSPEVIIEVSDEKK